MRTIILIAAVLAALSASPSSARTPFDGIWLFDAAPDYPDGSAALSFGFQHGRAVERVESDNALLVTC